MGLGIKISGPSTSGSGGGGTSTHAILTATNRYVNPSIPPSFGGQMTVMVDQDTVGGRQPIWHASFVGQPATLDSTDANTFSVFIFVASLNSSFVWVWRFSYMAVQGSPIPTGG